MRNLKAICCCARNRAIGLNGGLPWTGKIPGELAWFKEKTMGQTLVCGARTFETLPYLPGRKLLVLSRKRIHNPKYDGKDEDFRIITDINDIPGDSMVIGGARVFNELMPYTNEFWLTELKSEFVGDTFLEPFAHLFKNKELVKETEQYIINKYYC